jgi:hypothetical protein
LIVEQFVIVEWREHPETKHLSSLLASEYQRHEDESKSDSDADFAETSDEFDERQEDAAEESDSEQSGSRDKQPEVLTSNNPFELLGDDDD